MKICKSNTVIFSLLLLLGIGATSFAEVKFKFNGDLFYILRYDHFKKVTDTTTKSGNLSHNYIWNLKAKATVNENLSMGVRLSNPAGYGSNQITDNWTTFGKSTGTNSSFILAVPELYFNWNVGPFALMAGNIPVKGNVPLDLAAWEPTGYVNLCKCGWIAVMNNSLTGLDATMNFIKKESFEFSLKAIWARANEGGTSDPKDLYKTDQNRLIVSTPLTIAKNTLSLIPLLHLRTNVARSGDESNTSASGGLDVAIKLNKVITIKTGFAAGGYSNDSQKDDSGYVATAPMGMLATLGTDIKPGLGKIMFTAKYSTWEDRESGPKNLSLHTDLKYSIPVKKLAIMPRFRMWSYFNDENDNKSFHFRPEIFLISKF